MDNTPFTKEELTQKIDIIPDINSYTGRIRAHQGWWRLNVLNEKAGINPVLKNCNVCNTIIDGEATGKNFLTKNTLAVTKSTLENRTPLDSGKIEENRLYNNLLSSQPLCFNFFGELDKDREFGLKVLRSFWKDVTRLNKVLFEYSPPENYTEDGSAFDIGFDVDFGNKKGFIGLECKYTDTFSFKPKKSKIFYGDIGNKNHEIYQQVFNASRISFKAEYFDYVRSKEYNQLFRNQLMAESMLANKKFDIVKTGIFCYPFDSDAISAAKKFQSLLVEDKFKIITYADFITNTQQLDLTWEQREWTMMLWARYCAMSLSENVYKQIS